MSQLLKLSKPFPSRFIEQKGTSFKADYVSHSTVTEFLLGILGSYSFEHVSWMKGQSGLEGGVFRLTAEVDGKTVVIEEVGSIGDRRTDSAGEKAKDIASDAIKRCAMRLGLGLHLWSQNNYVLHDILSKKTGESE
jgi:hypothetical protein|tara:strand:+ start:240 stop:647 length:408 start_codon:yes stop_codon:yes gene_type:complete